MKVRVPKEEFIGQAKYFGLYPVHPSWSPNQVPEFLELEGEVVEDKMSYEEFRAVVQAFKSIPPLPELRPIGDSSISEGILLHRDMQSVIRYLRAREQD